MFAKSYLNVNSVAYSIAADILKFHACPFSEAEAGIIYVFETNSVFYSSNIIIRTSLFNTFSRLIPFAYPIDFGVGTCSISCILSLKHVLF